MDGCIATGATKEEVERNMKEAINFHLEGILLDSKAAPVPRSYSSYVEVLA